MSCCDACEQAPLQSAVQISVRRQGIFVPADACLVGERQSGPAFVITSHGTIVPNIVRACAWHQQQLVSPEAYYSGNCCQPIAIETLDDSRLRGYSDALGLYVCWEDRRLRFFDSRTESYLLTHAEAHAKRIAIEARIAELEAEIRRLRGE